MSWKRHWKRPEPQVARIWRGRTSRDQADAYEAYNYKEGIQPLLRSALGVQTFREDREGETEFVTISYWESVEAMSAFTGGDPRQVHHLPRDAEFLLELPDSVQILQLRVSEGTILRQPAINS
jgi:heme-degrading monooxygenase HmoA